MYYKCKMASNKQPREIIEFWGIKEGNKQDHAANML